MPASARMAKPSRRRWADWRSAYTPITLARCSSGNVISSQPLLDVLGHGARVATL